MDLLILTKTGTEKAWKKNKAKLWDASTNGSSVHEPGQGAIYHFVKRTMAGLKRVATSARGQFARESLLSD